MIIDSTNQEKYIKILSINTRLFIHKRFTILLYSREPLKTSKNMVDLLDHKNNLKYKIVVTNTHKFPLARILRESKLVILFCLRNIKRSDSQQLISY